MRYIGLTAVLLLAACGDGGTTPTSPPTTPTPPTPVATSITLSATSLSFSSLGETSQLTATVQDQNGATMSGASVTWATSAASVATVSSSGLKIVGRMLALLIPSLFRQCSPARYRTAMATHSASRPLPPIATTMYCVPWCI